MRAHRWPIVGLVALALAVLWPLPLGQRALGHPGSDLADHLWGAWWWGGALLSGHLPLHTTISHLPAGQPFWYVDPVGAALALLLRPFGFSAAWDLVLFVEVLGAGLALYALAWRRLRSVPAAFLAGALGVSAPYLLGLLHSGLTEYLGIFFPVLVLGAGLEAAEGRRWAWLAAGLGVALSTLQAFYYGAFACLLLAALVVGPEPGRRVLRLLPAFALGLVLSAPLLWLAGGTLFGVSGAVDASSAPGWQQVQLPATDLTLYLRPGKHYFPDTPALGNPGILHVHYLGWVALLLAAWGFARHPGLRTHRWAALLFLVLALGPAIAWNGRPVMLGDMPAPLPLAFLYRVPHSVWRLVHHPYRLTAFLVPLLALGAAAAVARGPRWLLWAALPLALAENLLLSPAVWPLPLTDTRAPAVYAELPGPGGVLDWPPDATTWNRRYELWQVQYRRPIPYGVNVFLRDPILQDPLVAALVDALEDPARRVRNRDVPGDVAFPPPHHGATTGLGAFGLRFLVLHCAALSERENRATRATLAARLGPSILRTEGEEVWEIPGR
ncbi:MAG: hypothetical protein ABIO70_05295 [Pseudomonadota bacterium]